MESHLEKACYFYTFTYLFLFYNIKCHEMAYWPPLMGVPESFIEDYLVWISPILIAYSNLFFISHISSLSPLSLSLTFSIHFSLPFPPPHFPSPLLPSFSSFFWCSPPPPPSFAHASPPALLPYFFLPLCFLFLSHFPLLLHYGFTQHFDWVSH